MHADDTPRAFARAGMLLILLALITGLALPAFTNPRMAMAAHVTGILSGLLLVAAGSTWPLLSLSERVGRVARVTLLAAAYANWVSACLAAAWGTTRNTPIAGAGFGASAWQESVVQLAQVAMGVALLVALAMVVAGLRRRAA